MFGPGAAGLSLQRDIRALGTLAVEAVVLTGGWLLDYVSRPCWRKYPSS